MDVAETEAGSGRGRKIEAAKVPAEINIRELRERLGLSQGRFARAFGFSMYSIQNWEQGRRTPDGAVRAYLKVISACPDMVREALLA